ncbi:MAG: DegV family protein [Candidatus Limivicinus sp.]
MSFSILTDTAANVPTDRVEAAGIKVLPLPFFVDGIENTCMDTLGFNAADFYGHMREGVKITTSQVNPHRYTEAMTELLQKGEDILFVGISSGVSGSFNSACIAADQLLDEFPDRKIQLVDSLGASLGEGLLVIKAAELRDQGLSLEETAETLRKLRVKMCQIFTVDDLNYLRRGGRLSGAAAIAGTVLNLKPLLKGNEIGKIVSFGKIRGRKKTIEALAKKYDELVEDAENQIVGISHADCEEDAKLLAGLIGRSHPPKDILIVNHEPATGSYLGPGALALYFEGAEDVRSK